MERNRYQFFMCNKRTTEKELIYEGWHTEGDMVTMTAGILVGLHRFRPASDSLNGKRKLTFQRM